MPKNKKNSKDSLDDNFVQELSKLNEEVQYETKKVFVFCDRLARWHKEDLALKDANIRKAWKKALTPEQKEYAAHCSRCEERLWKGEVNVIDPMNYNPIKEERK